MRINIVIGDLSLEAKLSKTSTASKITRILPLTARFSTWGEEIYFTIPVEAELDETAREEVELGDLGYWPTGNALCIFFGETPMSVPGKIIPASAVNIIGRIIGDATRLKGVMKEREITIKPL